MGVRNSGMRRRDMFRASVLGLAVAGLGFISGVSAQGAPSWVTPDLLAAAKAEGGTVIELYERLYADWSDLVFFKKATSAEQPADGEISTSKF